MPFVTFSLEENLSSRDWVLTILSLFDSSLSRALSLKKDVSQTTQLVDLMIVSTQDTGKIRITEDCRNVPSIHEDRQKSQSS